jgi:hypothetical protein
MVRGLPLFYSKASTRKNFSYPHQHNFRDNLFLKKWNLVIHALFFCSSWYENQYCMRQDIHANLHTLLFSHTPSFLRNTMIWVRSRCGMYAMQHVSITFFFIAVAVVATVLWSLASIAKKLEDVLRKWADRKEKEIWRRWRC